MDTDYDTWERSTCIAHAFLEEGDDILYLSVHEFYVGTYKENGGNGLRTTRYELHIGDEEGSVDVKKPITPWQMIAIGEEFLRAGLRQLREETGTRNG